MRGIWVSEVPGGSVVENSYTGGGYYLDLTAAQAVDAYHRAYPERTIYLGGVQVYPVPVPPERQTWALDGVIEGLTQAQMEHVLNVVAEVVDALEGESAANFGPVKWEGEGIPWVQGGEHGYLHGAEAWVRAGDSLPGLHRVVVVNLDGHSTSAPVSLQYDSGGGLMWRFGLVDWRKVTAADLWRYTEGGSDDGKETP